jgi:hypothetical protein
MGIFDSGNSGREQGRGSAEGGNGHVRDTSHTAAGRHSAIETANLQAVRDLAGGAPSGYEGKHRS